MNCIEALKHIVFKQLSEVAKDISMPAYVVGGFVRDFFLGIENDDIDMLPASARNAGSLCKSSGTEAGADTAK
jgi:hypothetical protein